jgi:thiol-disulfide isomerase/thioredoxin
LNGRTARLLVAPLTIVILLCVAGCSTSHQQDETAREYPGQSPMNSVDPAKKVEFISFCAKWCESCREVPPVLDRLTKEFPAVSYRELNIDEDVNFKLYLKYKGDKEDGIPFMFVLVDDQPVAHMRGILPYDEVAKFLSGAIAKHASARRRA